MADIELLNKAIESFNSASATLEHYYRTLEDKVGLLTEEVEHKKQLLDSILDSIDVGVVFFDRDGVIRLVNSAVESLLSVRAADLVGGASIHAVISGEIITPENGRPFYAIVSRSDVKDREGSGIGHVVIFKDITRLKQLEIENERNRRLTAMGELVLKIAHEIRNPLGSIELFASLLSGDLKGTEHGDYANRISNSVRYLVNALDNMLRFSKEIRPSYEICCINEVMEEICAEGRGLLPNDRIRFTFDAEDRYFLSMDRGLIRQALINMLLNSVQAIPGKGDIGVKAARRSGPPGAVAPLVEIRIKDSGMGMDEETRTRIFEPFFSTKDRGTGLGMSIAVSIISAHKGTLEVQSEPDKGTEFIITLPAAENSEVRGKAQG
jgi:signal transduction histidine kinase